MIPHVSVLVQLRELGAGVGLVHGLSQWNSELGGLGWVLVQWGTEPYLPLNVTCMPPRYPT